MTSDAVPEDLSCPTCLKRTQLCQCGDIVKSRTRLFVLILQHPQEQDRELGTARLALAHLLQGKLAVGLSWPNLMKALGRPTEPKRWAVVHLGSAHLPADAPPVAALDKNGGAIAPPALDALDGIVLLDGSWSQAKALWWRNAWLLKLHRLVLTPPLPSRYGRLRKEPRRESVSTLEAAALLLDHLEGRKELASAMTASFETLLRRYRAQHSPAP